MAQARVKWIEGKTMLGVDKDGHGVLITAGGEGPGASPMQLLLLGLGSCSMADVVSILQKQHQPLVDVHVLLSGERAAEHPRAWTAIHLHFIVSGEGLDANKVARAIDLSVEKYCGAHATLSGVADITHGYEIRAASASAGLA
jgi:putative redox protein